MKSATPQFTLSLGRYEAMCGEQQIRECVPANARQTNENAGIVFVMILQVVHVRITLDQLVPIVEIEANGESPGLGARINRGACEHLSANFQGERSVARALFHLRKCESDLPYSIEANLQLG